MARNVARLKMGFYPLPESEVINLRALLTFTGPASVVDPCAGQGVALNLITQGVDVRRYGVELDAERALAASAKGIATILCREDRPVRMEITTSPIIDKATGFTTGVVSISRPVADHPVADE